MSTASLLLQIVELQNYLGMKLIWELYLKFITHEKGHFSCFNVQNSYKSYSLEKVVKMAAHGTRHLVFTQNPEKDHT